MSANTAPANPDIVSTASDLVAHDLDTTLVEITRANNTAKSLQQATATMATVGGALGVFVLRGGGAPIGGVVLLITALLLGLLFDQTVQTLAPRLPKGAHPVISGGMSLVGMRRDRLVTHYLTQAAGPVDALAGQVQALAAVALAKHRRNHRTALLLRITLVVGAVGTGLAATGV